jgi:hypothetical protein
VGERGEIYHEPHELLVRRVSVVHGKNFFLLLVRGRILEKASIPFSTGWT